MNNELDNLYDEVMRDVEGLINDKLKNVPEPKVITTATLPLSDRSYTASFKNVNLSQVLRPVAMSTPTVGSAGNLTGTYYYATTFYTATGETDGSLLAASVAPSAQQVNLTGIPVSSDPAVIGRKIYRTVAGGSSRAYFLVTTIADNTTTTYTDNLVDGSLGVAMPWVNTTGSTVYVDNNGTKNKIITIDQSTTAVGYLAANSGKGSNMTAIGYQVFNSVTPITTASGNANVGLGNYAGTSCTSGSSNVILGYTAGLLVSTGSQNTIVGTAALSTVTTGAQNVAIGNSAGALVTAAVNGLVAIGNSAGNVALSSNNNVFIGSSAGTTNQVTTVSNSIAIGKLAYTNRSNQVVFGDDLITETQLHGKVMIGSTNNTAPNSLACLDMSVNTALGMYLPLVTTTIRDSTLASAPAGTMIFNSTTSKINIKGASAWEAVTSA